MRKVLGLDNWDLVAQCVFKVCGFKYILYYTLDFLVRGALSGLRQFCATKSSLKMMKNALYFTIKAVFDLKIFKFLS